MDTASTKRTAPAPHLSSDLPGLRRAAALTQSELAARLGVSQNRVSAMELAGADRARLATLRRLVSALGGTVTVQVQMGDQVFELV